MSSSPRSHGEEARREGLREGDRVPTEGNIKIISSDMDVKDVRGDDLFKNKRVILVGCVWQKTFVEHVSVVMRSNSPPPFGELEAAFCPPCPPLTTGLQHTWRFHARLHVEACAGFY